MAGFSEVGVAFKPVEEGRDKDVDAPEAQAESVKLTSDPDDDDDQQQEAVQVTPVLEPYSVSDVLRDGCFLSQNEIERLLERLRAKKNLILQGPPGTGKTWIAKRLAFALMGEKDDRRIRVQMAQWAGRTTAAKALAQTSARFGSGDTALARLVRERQDLANRWQASDKALNAALAKPQVQRAGADERARQRMVDIDARIAEIDRRLKEEFPDYFILARPEPLSVGEVQSLLGSDEALITLVSGIDEETFVFAVTRDKADWHRVPLGRKDFSAAVAELRKGLDIDAVRASIKTATPSLFNLSLAHALYVKLLGPIEPLIRTKRHLMVVASGPMSSLPLTVLVTSPPTATAPHIVDLASYRDASWLIARHAVTTLPSVASLKALRLTSVASTAPKPIIGFGDPQFDRGRKLSAPKVPGVTVAATRGYASYWKGRGADLDALANGLAPLPETAGELRAVAKALGAGGADLRLGPDATETALKRSDLNAYRVIYFATHGLIAGEVKGLGEPALVLTLPREATDIDDGLLTASEIVQLKLNADWVVLSACNTAAGDTLGADALSGLARAFFYAGSRALLVSHWRVDSNAAVRLSTATFDNMRRDPTIGRAEALRQSMLAHLRDQAHAWNAYPAFWAPFVVVGEGGATNRAMVWPRLVPPGVLRARQLSSPKLDGR